MRSAPPAGRSSTSLRLAIAILVLGALTGTAAIAAFTVRESGVEMHQSTPLAVNVSFAPRAGERIDPLPAVSAAPPPALDPAQLTVVEGKLAKGQSLDEALGRHGIADDLRARLAAALSGAIDPSTLQPGNGYRLALAPDGSLVEFNLTTSLEDGVRVEPWGDGYVARPVHAEVVARVARVAGVVTSSLYDAVRDLGETPSLASDFADIFAWDMDFSRAARAGDEFRILYERRFRVDDAGHEEYIGPGRILSAQYTGTAGTYTVVYYQPEEGEAGYYRPDGSSIQRQFLQAPLRYTHISSRYNLARHHPILKITRPHHGIDYAAPVGTPIWSVAEGEVIYKGWAGGFGNLVKVQHPHGYVSYYAHLSRYAAGLKVGQQVGQKQTVGYVGSTGLSTGPHVCFRIQQNGNYVNPAAVHTPGGDPVSLAEQHKFRAARDVLLAELSAGPLLATEDAL